jgi:hypothetical protein
MLEQAKDLLIFTNNKRIKAGAGWMLPLKFEFSMKQTTATSRAHFFNAQYVLYNRDFEGEWRFDLRSRFSFGKGICILPGLLTQMDTGLTYGKPWEFFKLFVFLHRFPVSLLIPFLSFLVTYFGLKSNNTSRYSHFECPIKEIFNRSVASLTKYPALRIVKRYWFFIINVWI